MASGARSSAPVGPPGTAAVRLAAHLYAGFLAAQAALGVVLWLALALSPTVRGWFELLPGHGEVTDAFVFADLGLIVVGSAAGAWGLGHDRDWTVPIVAFTAGAVVYPTLYLLCWVTVTGGQGVVGLGVMVATSILTCWIAFQTWRAGRAGRRA